MIKKEELFEVKKYGKKLYCLTQEVMHFNLKEFYRNLHEVEKKFDFSTLYFTQVTENNYLIWANIHGEPWSTDSYVLTLGTIRFDEFSFMPLKEIEASRENKRAYAFSREYICYESKKIVIKNKMKENFTS